MYKCLVSNQDQFEKDSYKRFEMLLKKTENFSHCLSAGDIAAMARMFTSDSCLPEWVYLLKHVVDRYWSLLM